MTHTQIRGAGHPPAPRPLLLSRRNLRAVFCAGPILIGLAALAGWLMHLPLLATMLPGTATMKANSALGMAAAGAGSWLIQGRRRAGARARRWFTWAAGASVLILGAATVFEYVSGLTLGLDEWLVADPHTTSPPYPGRMSPVSAIALCGAGLAILLLCAATSQAMSDARRRVGLACAAHLLALVPSAIGYFCVIGYAYHLERLDHVGAFVAVPLPTAIGFLLLGPGILLTQSRLGWARALSGHPAARHAFRRLLPAALLFPFLAGLVVAWGARAGIYDPLYGSALLAFVTAGALILMAWSGAMRVRGAEAAPQDANSCLATSEQRLRAANESLQARVREEVAAREQAQVLLAHAQRMGALGQLAGGIAHDFNNVMQAIQGGAGLIRLRTADPGAVDDIARVVEASVERGMSVTRRLLSFTRPDDSQDQHIDPAALLNDLRDVLAHGFGSLIEVKVRITLSGGRLGLIADKGQVETVLVNLATNGRDAMPGGGTLTLSAAEDTGADGAGAGSFIRLDVTDTGEGMPDSVLARAAEPFFTTKAPGQGTGLGLAMARSFAEQAGGRMAITSAPGRGTAVTLWLPSARVPVIRRERGAAGSGRGQGIHLLIVDDEKLVREMLATGLEDHGYKVAQAADGAAALALLRSGIPIGVILTDYAMPGMNGLALIREARVLRPGLPAVLLTGSAALCAVNEAEGIRRLRKPVRAGELAACIAALVEPARERRTA